MKKLILEKISKENLVEIIKDMFNQTCGGYADGFYRHEFVSCWEMAQELLIRLEIIHEKECNMSSGYENYFDKLLKEIP